MQAERDSHLTLHVQVKERHFGYGVTARHDGKLEHIALNCVVPTQYPKQQLPNPRHVPVPRPCSPPASTGLA